MDALISYFSDLEKRPLERAGFFIAGMVFLWIIENAIPLLQTHYKKSKGRHAAAAEQTRAFLPPRASLSLEHTLEKRYGSGFRVQGSGFRMP